MMLGVVPDVNILVSALIRPDGNSARIIDQIGIFTSYTSRAILQDAERVLHYDRIRKKYKLSEERIFQYLEDLNKSHVIVSGIYEMHGFVSDPDDDILIACALESGADYIISGDPHLLNMKQYREIRIVTPRAFLEILDHARA